MKKEISSLGDAIAHNLSLITLEKKKMPLFRETEEFSIFLSCLMIPLPLKTKLSLNK
jgi:hypothetical protein